MSVPSADRPHHRVWPRRLPRALRPPQTSLWDNLATSARRYPDKPGIVFFDRVFPYAELQRQAERLAARLHALGVRKGDRVLLDMQNCPQLV
ncbi:MAG TPA: AMP-binding protein, partial [Ramlibacter sp.]|nr:AMP-binding protein [Ramlibacter sp.]